MTDILKTIRERHSTREPFDPGRPVKKQDLKLILEAARWAPTPNNMQNFEILLVDAKERLDAIAKIPAEMSEAFLRENYDQLSFSKEELQIKKTGMLAESFPPAWTNSRGLETRLRLHLSVDLSGQVGRGDSAPPHWSL